VSAPLPAAARRPWRGRILAFVGIVLVALSLRTAVAAISPILGQISHDIPLSALVVGLLGAVPPVAFAVSGLLAPALSRRTGLDGGLLLAIAVMVLGHLGRAVAPNAVVLLVATVVTLFGVGVANVLLPPVVKRYFPDRIATVTAIYITVMSIGASIPALIAVPVADSAGWRVSLGLWCVVALLAVLPWVGMLARSRRARLPGAPPRAGVDEPESALEGRMSRSPIAWAMVGAFGAAAFASYATFAWLPTVLVDTAGVSRTAAGGLLALWAFMGFPSGVLAPILAARLRRATPLFVAAIVFFVVGDGGLLLAPAAAPWLWVVLAGLGPLLFPLVLALINLRTRTHAGSVALSGFVQGIAYAIGAAGPLVIGLLHDATDGWTVPLVVLIAVAVVLTAPALVVLGRPRFVEDELARRPRR
jgi:MFS transporter, CP family, cyanate transporter